MTKSVLLSVPLAFITCSIALADNLDEKEFRRLHQELVPKNETWKTIPWHDNLISAQQAAVEQGKPIFVWAMDGHPLGCT